MDDFSRSEPNVRVSYDEMEAYLTLSIPSIDSPYTFADIKKLLKDKGIVYGVDERAIMQMIEERIFNREILIAKGKPVVDGKDGYFEYNFDTNFNHKPTIRPDGSVDYWSIHAVELVEEGQVIAIYHEPVAGENGATVKGKVKLAKRGKPLPPLTGKGFERSEDNHLYVATVSGKIEQKERRITISSVYEIYGNADISTGDIDFHGDVIIHGNVVSNITVKATGSITIDGVVEAANVYSKKDIVIRGGMAGKGVGTLKADGCIFANYIEYANVDAGGAIQVNSLLDSQVTCHDWLLVQGKTSGIVNGNAYASRGVEATFIGNESEIATEVSVGVGREVFMRLRELEMKFQDLEEQARKIEEGLIKFEELAEVKEELKNDPRRIKLLRAKILLQTEQSGNNMELQKVRELIEISKGAVVKVTDTVFPGVRIMVDDKKVRVKDFQREVVFTEYQGKLVMFSLNE